MCQYTFKCLWRVYRCRDVEAEIYLFNDAVEGLHGSLTDIAAHDFGSALVEWYMARNEANARFQAGVAVVGCVGDKGRAKGVSSGDALPRCVVPDSKFSQETSKPFRRLC